MNNETITTEHIWELLSAKLRSFLLQRVSDPQVADDLLQEIFLRIHQKLDDVADDQRITSWVFQIARNLVVDHYRSKSREHNADMPNDVAAPTQGQENLNELIEGWLPTMIAQLPDTYREAVELYELKEMPQQQIADQLNISLSGAKSRIQRGRTKLKSLLFECCSFEQDSLGNVIEYTKNSPGECSICDEEYNS
ncbi:MAG: RNA polymerase sigma factor SigZ [Nitrospirales bacterium]